MPGAGAATGMQAQQRPPRQSVPAIPAGSTFDPLWDQAKALVDSRDAMVRAL